MASFWDGRLTVDLVPLVASGSRWKSSSCASEILKRLVRKPTAIIVATAMNRHSFNFIISSS
jgi:hypothetical protein